ncbi:dienelactone hydrolase [Saccharothrix tamanrassetensis]|uniref:Dienelactone hydrolase n=1 Tax=Saccharothrix tamanrassetensis TaxID=1051531 RepID=A0A841CMA9_9PSEU|nr:alpha/beta hydrolase [Saccharothrix tamanrassetensis]MBB5957227.1 dienelactone hydrolase [Saccharothrix tamanrassetensis]
MARRFQAVIAGVVTVAALVAPAGASPGESVQPRRIGASPGELVLPAPTGRHPIGWARLHLVDEDRTDPWVPTGPRELMVSVWYPAAAARGDRVPYATAEESRLLLAQYGITDVPSDALTRIRTHARVGAPPLRTPHHRRPLVVLSPGLAFPRWTLTTPAEDLASRGYVVVGVDHTYEGAAVTFPDGRVAVCVVCAGGTSGAAIIASRALDISFVLDRVLDRYRDLIDPHRIMAAGHSIGGAAAATTMLADSRVDAGVNLDGSFQPALTQDLPRPFLLVSAEDRSPGLRPDWDRTWPHLTGWRRWLHVPDVGHASLSDASVVVEWLGLPTGPLPGARVVEITRTYVAAFADKHLRHRSQPLLDGPSPRFPEVHFVGPPR